MERSDFLRIDKMLSNLGYGSRKEVKQLLKRGQVEVNDTVIKDGKTHIDTLQGY